jgi:hypothetical protein
MNTTGATDTISPAGLLTEITIGWGEDTNCTGCFTDLPAGAPAWEDADSLLCADCAEAEMSLRAAPETAAERRRVLVIVQAAIRAAVALARRERHDEFPVPAEYNWDYR